MNPLKNTLPLLGQLVKWLPAKSPDALARKHKIQTRSFGPTSHVVTMMFAQLSHALSLNDVCDALQNHQSNLSQIRNCTPPSRNGLSHANRTRNADMAEELFWLTMQKLKDDHPTFMTKGRCYPGLPHRFTRMVHAVDSSTISLVANSMEWAKHRRQKAAAKLHMDLNMQSFLPSFAIVKRAKDADPKVAWEVCAHLKDGEIAVLDKAYVDFKHLFHLDQRGIFWVTRAKDNMQYEVMGQQAVAELHEAVDAGGNTEKVMGQQVTKHAALRRVKGSAKGKKRKYKRKAIKIIRDVHIKLANAKTFENYPQELRLVEAEVEVKKKMETMTFISNNFNWSAVSICELYRARWGIEVFFKEIKQTLQLADFMGYNENAVRWQIWIALLVYLLLRFVAWRNKWKHSFSRLFTLVRGVIWNYFDLPSILARCDTMGRRMRVRASPERSYQMCFDLS
jgi:hypothetical protein